MGLEKYVRSEVSAGLAATDAVRLLSSEDIESVRLIKAAGKEQTYTLYAITNKWDISFPHASNLFGSTKSFKQLTTLIQRALAEMPREVTVVLGARKLYGVYSEA